MPALMFDKCCLCIELKTGCFLIGYFNLIGIAILTILTAMGVVTGAAIANDGNPEHHQAGLIIAIVAGIVLIFMILALAFAIVLVVGLHKNKPGHLKAYLIYNLIFMIMSVIQFIIKCSRGDANASQILQSLFTILLGIYFMLVIRSMYFRMKDPSKGPAIYSAA